MSRFLSSWVLWLVILAVGVVAIPYVVCAILDCVYPVAEASETWTGPLPP